LPKSLHVEKNFAAETDRQTERIERERDARTHISFGRCLLKLSELISVLGKTSIRGLIKPAALISTAIVSTRGFVFVL
jgi:hypothetical protein